MLGVPTPGLLLLRYRSALVLDELIRTVRPLLAPRPLREIRFDPRIPGPAGNPDHLAAECRSLAGADTPVLFLRPEPGAAADLPEMAPFWKELNARREALGATQALIVLCLDDAHTAAAFHHAKDLLSWCSPKFEFLTLTGLGSEERRLTATKKTLAPLAFQAPAAEWAALHPLWEQTLASGRPLTAELTRRLVLPLLRAAVDNGMVTAGSTLIRQAGNLAFYNEHQRGDWLNLCGELAVAQGDLAGALRFFTEDKAIAERLAASDPANAAWQRALSVSLIKLGNLAVAQGDLAGALRSFTESKAIRERLVASDPANAEWQRDLSYSLTVVAQVFMKLERWREALPMMGRSLAIDERLANSDPTNVMWQNDAQVSRRMVAQLRAKAAGS